MSYLSSFIRLTWLTVGAYPVFVAVTEREIRVRTYRQTVLINANFWPRVQHQHPYCATITSGSVPFRSVPGFIPSHSNALANIEKAQEHQKKHYDAKHNTNTKLKVGDKVLVKNMKNEGRKGGKLDQLFH